MPRNISQCWWNQKLTEILMLFLGQTILNILFWSESRIDSSARNFASMFICSSGTTLPKTKARFPVIEYFIVLFNFQQRDRKSCKIQIIVLANDRTEDN